MRSASARFQTCMTPTTTCSRRQRGWRVFTDPQFERMQLETNIAGDRWRLTKNRRQ